MKITILGCGTSGGVPFVGCTCAVCTSNNPKNKRLRVSVLVEHRDTKLLIDMSPDLREQCLRNGLKIVDAILLTHAHADHCHGIDDVRALNYHKNGPIDLYADAATLEELQERFPYVFKAHQPEYGWYKPSLTPHVIPLDLFPTFSISSDFSIRPFEQQHGKMKTLGLRIENFAYSTDVNNLSEQSLQVLENLDLLVVDCLQYKPAPTHAHLELALSWIERLKPKRAVLTHMGHAFDYDTLKSQLPQGVEPAYDGMVLEI